MQKIAIGMLSLAALTLAAMNARHQERERILEERLAAAEKKSKRKPPPVQAAPAESPAPVPVAAPPASAVAAETAPPTVVPAVAPAPKIAEALDYAKVLAFDSGLMKTSFVMTDPEAELNLTDAQRGAIDRLRELQSSQTREIDERTEQAIRSLLTSDQRQKYESRNTPKLQTYWLGQVEYSGLKPGFLGVSGGDASGGGAEVTNVIANSAASASGLLAGDVILQVNGEPVAGLGALSETIRKSGEGFAANLLIRRGGVEFIQGVQLGGASK